MSLINEMLKDLEKRPREAIEPEELLAGLRFNAASSFKKNKSYYLVILILLALLASISWIGLIHKKKLNQTQATTAPSPVVEPVAPPAQTPPTVVSDTSLLTGVALQLQDNTSSLRLMLNKKATYSVIQNKNELTIQFTDTQLSAALPDIDYQGSGIEKLEAFSDEKKNLKLVIQLATNTQVKNIKMSDDDKAPELQLDVISRVDDAVVHVESHPVLPSAPEVFKKPIQVTDEQQGYNAATLLINSKKPTQAEHMLRSILSRTPSALKSRELLINLLLDEKNFVEADKVVTEGLNIDPDQDSLLELKAKILTEQGKLKEALDLLIENAPALSQDPDYHSFIAALYQQTGQNEQAASLYKQLIGLQPNNSKWWIGLGIALESQGNTNQAMTAYANAENLGGLNPELQAYIDTRLHSA